MDTDDEAQVMKHSNLALILNEKMLAPRDYSILSLHETPSLVGDEVHLYVVPATNHLCFGMRELRGPHSVPRRRCCGKEADVAGRRYNACIRAAVPGAKRVERPLRA